MPKKREMFGTNFRGWDLQENFAGINFRDEEVDEYFAGSNFRVTRILHYYVNKFTFFGTKVLLLQKRIV